MLFRSAQTASGAGQLALSGSTVTTAFTGTAAISGGTMTVSAVSSGALTVGMAVNALGATAGTVVTGYLTGTGGTGTYVVTPSQTLGSTTIRGNAVSTQDKPRRVIFTSSGNDSGVTITIVGTTHGKAPATETVTGANATTASTVLDYLTITSVSVSGATAGTMSVGTNGIAGSPWVAFDSWALNTVAIQATASGTVNYTIQQTLDNPNDPIAPVAASAATWVNSPDPVVVAATTTQQSNYLFAPVYARVLMNSGTGAVTATFSQAGNVPA